MAIRCTDDKTLLPSVTYRSIGQVCMCYYVPIRFKNVMLLLCGTASTGTILLNTNVILYYRTNRLKIYSNKTRDILLVDNAIIQENYKNYLNV